MKTLLAIAVSALSVQAFAQVPIFEAGSVQTVALVSQDGYQEAVNAFNAYKASKGQVKKGNEPFLISKGKRTEHAAVLIHGLTDSPYFMKPLAEMLSKEGVNVVAVLLPGHGTKPEDLHKVKSGDWQRDVETALDIAAGLGDKVTLAGFSTGGALVLDVVARNQGRRNIANVILMSPAVRVHPDRMGFLARTMCAVPGATTLRPWVDGSLEENDPYRYNKMSTNGVCLLYDLTKQNGRAMGAIRSEAASKGIRFMALQSPTNRTVDPEAVSELMGSLGQDFGFLPEELGLGHSNVPLRLRNPRVMTPERLELLREMFGKT